MDGHRYRLSRRAVADFESILRESERSFGTAQRRRYESLIAQAAVLIAQDPQRGGSKARDDIRPGLRSFRVERASGRRGAASHVLFYLVGTFDDGVPGITIVRILHDRMDPERHIAGSLD